MSGPSRICRVLSILWDFALPQLVVPEKSSGNIRPVTFTRRLLALVQESLNSLPELLEGGVRSPTKYLTPDRFGIARTFAFNIAPDSLISRNRNFSDTWILQLSGMTNSFGPDITALDWSGAETSRQNKSSPKSNGASKCWIDKGWRGGGVIGDNRGKGGTAN